MDFNLKQWRHDDDDESASEERQQAEQESASPSKKLPRLVLNSNININHHQQQQQQNSVATALPLFVPEGGGPNTNLSPYHSSDINSNNKIARMGSGCFSFGQWQELELQASIYRHMIAGGIVPPELVQLVQKSLVSSSHPSTYYLSHPLPNQYYPHYQTANLVQSGYWGRAAMDPEPGRCRRTDGKKWRCSRDVVVGQKYCERHMNRGKSRSRKPVETNATSTTTTINIASNGGGDANNYPITTAQGTLDFGGGGGGGGSAQFTLSGSSPSMDLLHLNQRPKSPFETTQHDDQNPGGGRVLRRFFDDWPGSLNHTDNAAASFTDFSLKLGTGDNGDESRAHHVMSGHRDIRQHQLNWNHSNGWENNNNNNNHVVAHMGGPLAEALRSSGSTSSPTSVLHRLQRGSVASETSYVSS